MSHVKRSLIVIQKVNTLTGTRFSLSPFRKSVSVRCVENVPRKVRRNTVGEAVSARL